MTAPVNVFDAGNHLVLSGATREAVDLKLRELIADGARNPSQIVLNGTVWVASCENPAVMASDCTVEDFGSNLMISGPSKAAVEGKLKEVRDHGANPITAIELGADGRWTVVCDRGGERRW